MTEANEEQVGHPVNFWQRRWVQSALPFATSLTVHGAIIVVALATYTAIRTIADQSKQQIIIPDATMIVGADVGGIPNPGMGRDPDRAVNQADDPSVTESNVTRTSRNNVPASLMDPNSAGNSQVPAILAHGPLNPGHGNQSGLDGGLSAGALAQFGTPGGGGGMGPRSKLFGHSGNAMRIVYICDGSGSMLGKMDLLRSELDKDVGSLIPVQSFNVIFFQHPPDSSDYFINLSGGLLMATEQNKRKAYSFVDGVAPHDTTYVVPALDFAFKLNPKPDLIYLLTDGAFEDEGDDVVRAAIRKMDPDKSVKINTVLLLSEEAANPDNADALKPAMETMQGIANDTGANFYPVKMTDLLSETQ